MKLIFNKAQCFKLPDAFYRVIETEFNNDNSDKNTIIAFTLNFRDEGYSSESGGYHPVEIRFEKHDEKWFCIYITDFSFSGGPYPELVKEIDVCFNSKRVFSLYGGWLNNRDGNDLLTMFINNFIEYYNSGSYTIQISFN
ncbi:DUF2787 family protein [Thalassotalea sp. SU-HH00458]|uniref:DUF2787 family protein n=1 Tax=Thalassotalea sp. SU-HH00458 TaxID=3127657 RepID=UPI00310575AB